jgi:hypothetical protein
MLDLFKLQFHHKIFYILPALPSGRHFPSSIFPASAAGFRAALAALNNLQSLPP